MRFVRTVFALVAGLVVLAAGVVVSNTEPAQYTATASVRLTGSFDDAASGKNGNVPDADSLAARLASRENLLAALEAIDFRRGRAGDAAQSARRDQLADLLSAELVATTGGDGEGADQQLSVTYTGNDRNAATQIVNDVARQIAAQYADVVLRSTKSAHETAQAEENAAQSEWAEATAALDSAIAEHLTAVKDAAMAAPDDAAGRPRARSNEMPLDGSPSENLVWKALSKQLAAVEADLKNLRETKTPAHPLVLAAAWRLAQLKQQLEQTPRYLSDRPGEEHAPDPPQPQVLTQDPDGRWSADIAPGEKPRGSSATDIPEIAAAAATVHRRQEHLASARDRITAAAQAERAAWENHAAAKAELSGIVRIARPDDATGRQALQSVVLVAAVAALLVSLLVALPNRPKDRVLTTVDDARRRLSMPVLGVVSTA